MEMTTVEGEKSRSFLLDAIKLCSKNGGPTCSTPVTSWMEEFSTKTTFSARKLASVVWELHQFLYPVTGFTTNLINVDNRRNNSGYHVYNERVRGNRRRVIGFEGLDQFHQQQHQHPASAGRGRRHVADSLMRHHPAERNKHGLQPLSPASYGSSSEMAHHNPAATPDSSIEPRRRIGESSYSFKTSAELLKVLNRIWSLEQHHASYMTLVKGLKTELVHARGKIKQLLRDQRAYRHETNRLMKRISEDSLATTSKDLQSARNELDDERKLRARSESLRRKLARELFEVKVALATSVKEYEKKKKSSAVLEKLCDEFAKGILEFAREVHTTKQKPDKDWSGLSDQDNLILHMSESWLDERTHFKDRETQGVGAQSQPAVDRLRLDIETFLAARQVVESPLHRKETQLRRCSLESIPEAVTAPQNSAFSSKSGPIRYGEQEELALRDISKGQSPGITKSNEGTSTEINMLEKSDIYDYVGEQRKKAYDEEGYGSNSKTVDKLMSELLLSEVGSVPPKYECKEVGSSTPVIRRNASPTRLWMTSMVSPDPKSSEASSRTLSVKDNTLKARLQEAKSKGQQSRSKIMKGSS